MTTFLTWQSSEVTYPLSPFQRAALAYAARPLNLTVEVPLLPEILIERAEQALRASPELTASVRPVMASQIPHQVPNALRRVSSSSGVSKLVGGSLSLTAEPSETGTHLIINTDALFADAVSIELLCKRIADGPAAVGPVSFFDVAAGHATMLQEGELDQETAYWQAIPRGSDPRAALGSDPGTAERLTTASVPVDFVSLAEFASTYRVDPADVLCLSLHLLLNRVCPDGAILGRLVDARELMGLEGRSGLFTQVVLDVAEIDSKAAAVTLLEHQVQRHRKHAEMAGGPAMLEKSAPPTVVFDPRMTWQLPDGWRLAGSFEGRSGTLQLRGSSDGDRLSLVANVCDDTNSAMLRTILAAWADIVAAVVREPSTPWSLLQIGTTGRTDRPGVQLPTQTDSTTTEDICARLNAFATADPEASAVRRGEQVVTRRALVGRIGDLAAALGPIHVGGVVAVLVGVELDLLAGWLSVLWQGATFLPLSPAEPSQRIEHAITVSAACAVLVGDGVPTFNAPVHCRIIRFRDVEMSLRDPGPPAPTDPEQVAYLLRTSGSSGTPKIVAVGRRSLNNYLRWVAEDLLAEDGGDFPLVSSPIFDASFKQLLGPQYAGRSTWLLEADLADAEQAYAELLAADTPLSLNCTPTYWAEFLNIGRNAGQRLPLRKLLLGGEPVGEALVRWTADEYPDTEIWNFYGPTETTATATAGRLTPGEPIHVGKATAGAAVTVADQYGRALPQGMRGEVWISGPGLAKGYLGDVDQEAFGWLRVGERSMPAYRTGDTGRIDEHGRLRLGGRLDTQLKLRGWRIEPQEIERLAESTPGVVGATLLVDSRTEPHQLRLFVLGEADTVSVSEVLRDWLPPAMIPATVTRVGRFPRTATGKVDRGALLELVSTRPEPSPGDYEPLQLEIATIWRDIVRRGWPHIDEDFFSAGGDSLLLARLVNQLRARGHDNISLRQVVRNPTVNSIATIILASQR